MSGTPPPQPISDGASKRRALIGCSGAVVARLSAFLLRRATLISTSRREVSTTRNYRIGIISVERTSIVTVAADATVALEALWSAIRTVRLRRHFDVSELKDAQKCQQQTKETNENVAVIT